MGDKVVFEIAMNGADQISAQLSNVAKDVQNAFGGIGGSVSSLQSSIDKLAESIGKINRGGGGHGDGGSGGSSFSRNLQQDAREFRTVLGELGVTANTSLRAIRSAFTQVLPESAFAPSLAVALTGFAAIRTAGEQTGNFVHRRIVKVYEDAANAVKDKKLPPLIQEESLKEVERRRDVALSASNNIGKLRDTIGYTAVRGGLLAGGAAGLGLGLFEWAKGAGSAIHEMSSLSKLTGSSIEDISALKNVFAGFDVTTEQLSESFKRMSVRVGSEWERVQHAVREEATLAAHDMDRLASAGLNVDKTQDVLANSSTNAALKQRALQLSVQQSTIALNNLQTTQANDKVSLEQNAEASRLHYAKLLGYDTSYAEQQLAIRQAAHKVTLSEEELRQLPEKQDQQAQQAQLALDEARQKKRENAKAQEREYREQLLAGIKAVDEARTAELESIKRQENTPEGILKAFKEVGSAEELKRKSGPLTAEQFFQGAILKSAVDAEGGVEALIKKYGSLNEALQQIKPPKNQLDILAALAGGFREIETDGPRMQRILQDIFGRGFNPELAHAFATLGPNFKQAIAEASKGGGIFTTDQQKQADEFHGKLTVLYTTLDNLKNSLGSSFFDIFNEQLGKVGDHLKDSEGSLKGWSERVAANLKEPIQDIGALLAGEGKKALSADGIVKPFVEAASVIGSAFRSLDSVFAGASAAFKSFGVDISKGSIEILAAIFTLVGGFGLLKQAIVTFIAIAAFSPVVAGILAVAIALGVLEVATKDSETGFGAVSSAISRLVESAKKDFDQLKNLVTGNWDFSDVMKNLASLGERIGNMPKTAKENWAKWTKNGGKLMEWLFGKNKEEEQKIEVPTIPGAPVAPKEPFDFEGRFGGDFGGKKTNKQGRELTEQEKQANDILKQKMLEAAAAGQKQTDASKEGTPAVKGLGAAADLTKTKLDDLAAAATRAAQAQISGTAAQKASSLQELESIAKQKGVVTRDSTTNLQGAGDQLRSLYKYNEEGTFRAQKDLIARGFTVWEKATEQEQDILKKSLAPGLINAGSGFSKNPVTGTLEKMTPEQQAEMISRGYAPSNTSGYSLNRNTGIWEKIATTGSDTAKATVEQAKSLGDVVENTRTVAREMDKFGKVVTKDTLTGEEKTIQVGTPVIIYGPLPLPVAFTGDAVPVKVVNPWGMDNKAAAPQGQAAGGQAGTEGIAVRYPPKPEGSVQPEGSVPPSSTPDYIAEPKIIKVSPGGQPVAPPITEPSPGGQPVAPPITEPSPPTSTEPPRIERQPPRTIAQPAPEPKVIDLPGVSVEAQPKPTLGNTTAWVEGEMVSNRQPPYSGQVGGERSNVFVPPGKDPNEIARLEHGRAEAYRLGKAPTDENADLLGKTAAQRKEAGEQMSSPYRDGGYKYSLSTLWDSLPRGYVGAPRTRAEAYGLSGKFGRAEGWTIADANEAAHLRALNTGRMPGDALDPNIQYPSGYGPTHVSKAEMERIKAGWQIGEQRQIPEPPTTNPDRPKWRPGAGDPGLVKGKDGAWVYSYTDAGGPPGTTQGEWRWNKNIKPDIPDRPAPPPKPPEPPEQVTPLRMDDGFRRGTDTTREGVNPNDILRDRLQGSGPNIPDLGDLDGTKQPPIQLWNQYAGGLLDKILDSRNSSINPAYQSGQYKKEDDKLGKSPQDAWKGVTDPLKGQQGGIWDSVINAINNGATQLQEAFQSAGKSLEKLMPESSENKVMPENSDQKPLEPGQSENKIMPEYQQGPQAPEASNDNLKMMMDTLTDLGQSASQASTALDTVQQSAQEADRGLSSVGESAGSGSGGGGGGFDSGGGFASGGLIGGHGNGSSDSNVIRASRGEFMVNARATSHYGTDFLHSINRMTLTGYAMGGAIGRVSISPNVASNSEGHRNIVNLHIGGETHQLRASDDTASALQRMSVKRQVSSAGRQPNWVK